MKKRGLGGISSMLVSVPGLIAFLCFTVAAAVLRSSIIAGFCFFVFLLCGLSRLWGELAISRVSVAIGARSTRMFEGDGAEVSFSITNGKALPLIWLELLLPMPRRGCITPDGGFEEAPLALREEDEWEGKTALKKRFSFIMGRRTLEWSGGWTAKRRGVYRLDRLVLRSGDGFGLTQSQTVAAPSEAPVFVVYPTIRKVDITSFLTTQWDGAGGGGGFLDDPTVIRGLRRYESGDAWKRINWRLAARGQELSVNVYETITPKAVHFIFDVEAFCEAGDSEYEDALSLAASLLLRLSEARVMCGLSLPRSKYMPQTDIAAGGDILELLTALAGCDMLRLRDEEKSTAAHGDVFFPSDFDWLSAARAAGSAGRVYFITHDASKLRERGLPPRLDASRLRLLTYRDPSDDDADALGVRTAGLRSFGR